jgi:hypothetical protein
MRRHVRTRWSGASLILVGTFVSVVMLMRAGLATTADEVASPGAGTEGKVTPVQTGKTAPREALPAEEGPSVSKDTASGTAAPARLQRMALVDPETGKLVEAKDVDAAKIVKLPPGDIKGKVTEPDGTPHANTRIALLDAETGKEVMSTVTNDRGEYTLKDVSEGRYVVHVGNPGIGALLVVAQDAPAGELDIALPKAATAGSRGWLAEHPVWASVGLTTGLGAVAAGAYSATRGGHHEKKVISATSP